jgi:hypothetical protein
MKPALPTEAVEDGLLVAFDAVGEGVQVGLVVGVHGGEPVVPAVAVQPGEDLGELGDVAGARRPGAGSVPGPGRVSPFLVVEVVRVGADPTGTCVRLIDHKRSIYGRVNRHSDPIPHLPGASGGVQIVDSG